MTIETQAFAALSNLFGHSIKESPKLLKIMNDAKAGIITEADAMLQMMAVIQKNPDLGKKLMEHATTDMASLQDSENTSLIPPQPGVGDPNTPFFSRSEGLPGINPLYISKIVERLQFDNDIPELRTGPKKLGVPPAVSVDSDSRNPVSIGLMIQEAEKKLGEKVDALEMKRRQSIDAIALGKSKNLALMQQHSDLVALHGAESAKEMMLYGSQKTDHPEYRRGQIAAPMSVPAPNAGQLLKMGPKDAKDAAWKMFSSTQGRRTAQTAVRGIIINYLTSKKIQVRWREFDRATTPDQIKASHKWTANITGAQNLQAGFSILDIAGKSLGVELSRQMENQHIPTDLTLEITPVNQITDRVVGWAARLVSTFKPKGITDESK